MKYAVSRPMRVDDIRDVDLERVCEECGRNYRYRVKVDPRFYPGKMTLDKFDGCLRYLESDDGQAEYGVWCPHCQHLNRAAIQRAFPNGFARAVRDYRWRDAEFGSFVFLGLGGFFFVVAGLCNFLGISFSQHEPSTASGIVFVVFGIGFLLSAMQTTNLWCSQTRFNKRLAQRAKQITDDEFIVLLSKICQQYLVRETTSVPGGVYYFNHPFSSLVARWPDVLCFGRLKR
ncbi:hypothetical protein Mal52_44290 [Symmachiella dynata]|uniref:Uncharacterized protein n=1 Tax=Symmachiella dynata TaxID=2527995 RepID=A0A517ZTX2_9PLAN|nr:hypothetical protein [Symmachiella dynata]QDU45932.1 hypothetical protein Mal52_44290 [Symmachiella dynata]